MIKNKMTTSKKNKGVSLMLSYVLLVIIVLGLSIGVYAWLRFMAKYSEEIEKCPKGVELIIENYECDGKNISVSLKNKGRFNIEGISIKGTDNKTQEAFTVLKKISTLTEVGDVYVFYNPISPNEIESYIFSYQGLDKLEKIEIVPVKVREEEIILCEEAITQEVVGCL